MANKLTLRTYSGIEINPSDPRSENIELIDLAVALSRVNRYVGHTRFPYSVAQHSVLCSELAINEFGPKDVKYLAMACLLHDCAEAFTSDIPTPVKALLKPTITHIEDAFDAAIFGRFGLPVMTEQQKAQVKAIDEEAYLLEKDQLRHESWTLQYRGQPTTKSEIIIPRLTADEAALAFIRQFGKVNRL